MLSSLQSWFLQFVASRQYNMAHQRMWLILVLSIVIGNGISFNEAMVMKRIHTDGQENSGSMGHVTHTLQSLLKNVSLKDAKLPVDPNLGGITVSEITPTTEGDPKTDETPKHLIGKEELVHPSSTIGHPGNLTNQSTAPDHFEATISVDYTMSKSNATKIDKENESAIVSRELHEIMDSIPTLPPNIFYQDPEEEELNQRITEVARQLTESALRKEYEEGKMEHNLPLPSEPSYIKLASSNEKEVRKSPVMPDSKHLKNITMSHASVEREEKKQEPLVEKSAKPVKVGKAYVKTNNLAMVSYLPHEADKLQQIAEVQPILDYPKRFYPRILPPELSRQLNGEPTLQLDEETRERISKNIDFNKRKSDEEYMVMGVPTFFKLMLPKYGLKPDDLVLNFSANGGPTIISTSDE